MKKNDACAKDLVLMQFLLCHLRRTKKSKGTVGLRGRAVGKLFQLNSTNTSVGDVFLSAIRTELPAGLFFPLARNTFFVGAGQRVHSLLDFPCGS